MTRSASILLLCALVATAAAATLQFKVVRDEQGQEFALVPVQGDVLLLDQPQLHSRVRRQLSHPIGDNGKIFGNITPGGNGGAQLTGGASGVLLNGNGHTLTGTGQISKEVLIPHHGSGPTTLGGGLKYNSDRVNAAVNAAHTRGFGTGVNAEAGVNVYRSPDRRATFDVNGQYNQHFGGPGPRVAPQFGALGTFRYNFR